mgnify:CR=1 FL=1
MIEILPAETLQGVAEIPGSKSYTNRALLIAALAEGTSELHRLLHSDDTHYMAEALQNLGVTIDDRDEGRRWVIEGCGGRFSSCSEPIFVGNAGTAMRFLTAAICLGDSEYRLDGSDRMRQRPIQDLLSALEQLGCNAVSENGNGCPPLTINAKGIPGGTCSMPGDKSSQYFSALLMASPYAQADVTIEVEGELVSKPYIDMTIDIMQTFGGEVTHDDYQKFMIPSGQSYQSREYLIEPDASNACYYWAAGAIASGPVRVQGLSRSSIQGDIGFVSILHQMGCSVSYGPDWIEVVGGELRGGEFDLGNMPDTAQTLAVVALFARGKTNLVNIGNLRIKETDRIAALARELTKLGAKVDEGKDYLSITPGQLKGVEIETYDDHRMAMSFTLAGVRIPGVVILDHDCVAKTYPDYFDDMRRIGLQSRPADA